MKYKVIPSSTIERLPVYLHCLLRLRDEGVTSVRSHTLAESCDRNAVQIRKDLSYFGEFGKRGVGYDVDSLISQLSGILGVDEPRRVAIIGYGKFGQAIAGYPGFGPHGFHIVAAFDSDPAKVGLDAGGFPVDSIDDLEKVLGEKRVEICIMATPAEVTQELADRAMATGVKAVLNLAPVPLNVPEGVALRRVCLSADLQVLSYHLARSGL
jgi:redox-sensing transcriptional repressor